MQSAENYNNITTPPNLIGQQMDNNLHIHKSKYFEIEVIKRIFILFLKFPLTTYILFTA